MDPAFPDIVEELAQIERGSNDPANDNPEEEVDEIAERFLTTLAMLGIDATRAW